MYKRKPKIENISDYIRYKKIAHLTKPKSRTSVKFVSNDPDNWFIDKLCFKTKTGEIVLNEGINADSYEYWLQFYINKGYSKTK